MSKTLNLDVLNSFASKGVNIDKSIIDEALQEHMGKEKQHEVVTNSGATHNTLVTDSRATRHTLSCIESATDYHMLNRFPKVIMRLLLEQHENENVVNDDIFYVDTYQLKERTGKSASQIANTVKRLKDKGFICVHQSHKNGVRAISINKNLFQ